MKKSSFQTIRADAPLGTGQTRPLAKLSIRTVPDEERDLAAKAARIILAWHSAYLADDQIAGIGSHTNRVCHGLLLDRPPWLEQVWDHLVIVLGGLAGEAVACGSVRRSAADDHREYCRRTAEFLAGSSGTQCPWTDQPATAPGLRLGRPPLPEQEQACVSILNAALRRARLLLLRDRFSFEALRQALAAKPTLSDAELAEVIGPRPSGT